jgi:hypothetical protein
MRIMPDCGVDVPASAGGGLCGSGDIGREMIKPAADCRPQPSAAGPLAEEQGFEPWIRGHRITVFETAAFNHSATPPELVFYPHSASFARPENDQAGVQRG